jgi:hypothetical protein
MRSFRHCLSSTGAIGVGLRSTSLVLVATLALAFAGAASMPSQSVAQPNTSAGTGESDLCKSLLDRLKRYHAIYTNKNETQAVRDYYKAQAQLTLAQGRIHKCQWASPAALVSGVNTVAVDVAGGVATARTSKQLAGANAVRKTRRAARLAGGQTGPRPQATTTMAAIKAQPTGNAQQDEYCRAVADLIQDAYNQGDQAFIAGDDEGAQAWYDLAGEMTDRATQNGCRFTFLIRRVAGLDVRLAGVVIARL